jgi:hypothetical protein
MRQYKEKTHGRECEVADFIAAGMCKYTMGKTFVMYRYKDSKDKFYLVMEQSEFLKDHIEIKSKKK